MKLFVSGVNTKNDDSFETTIDSEKAIQLISLADDGRDDKIENELSCIGVASNESKVLNALTWIQSSEEIVGLLKNGERFAVLTEPIAFGISGDSFEDARESLDMQEF